MNKAQLTDAVAAATDSSKAEAGRAVEATLNAIAGSLAGGDSVSLVGFGTFNVRHRELEQVETLKQELLSKSLHLNLLDLKQVRLLKKACKLNKFLKSAPNGALFLVIK